MQHAGQRQMKREHPDLFRVQRNVEAAGMGWISVIAIGFRLKAQIYEIFAPLFKGFLRF